MGNQPRTPRPSLSLCYGAALMAAAFAVYALLPIVAWDKDLWYHLNGGRWIWEHRALPHEAFFSFLSPPRPWLDYYWLFELIVYALDRLGGFAGIVFLRAVLLTATLGAVWLLLMGRTRRPPALRCVLFGAYAVFLLPRFTLARPHMFSYLFLAASLLILERRPRWAHLLLPIAVLWGNLHGIYYPILLLAAGAYVLERLVQRPTQAKDPRSLAFTAAAMAAVFVTPLGAGLVDIPFIPLDYARWHINELAPFSTEILLSFHIDRMTPSSDACFTLVFWACVLSLILAALQKRLRLSHAVLFAGALLLLSRGTRFMYEYALLALPLLARSPLWDRGVKSRAVLAGLGVLPFFALYGVLTPRPRWPVSPRGLPQGIASFLKREAAGGTVLSDPGTGGYLEWALGPDWKIAADMRTPHLFSDADNYLTERAFQNPHLLNMLLSRDHPDFIAASLRRPLFKDAIAEHAEYAPVFFDDEAVLYADKARHADLVRRWKLSVDPFQLPDPAPKAGAAHCGLPPFLARMIAIAPETFSTQVYAAQYCSVSEDFRGELEHAHALMLSYPEETEGYLLAGNALRRMNEPREALGLLDQALRRAANPEKGKTVKREIAAADLALGWKDRAWSLLREADPSLPPDSWKDPVSAPAPRARPLRSRAGARSVR